jgi:hypothetical protein
MFFLGFFCGRGILAAACGGDGQPPKLERLRREPDNFKFLNDLSINHSSKFFNEK